MALIDAYSDINSYCRVRAFSKIIFSALAEYSYVGRNTAIYYTKIGKFTSIGMDCKIGLPSHTLSNISTSPIFTEQVNGTGSSWCNDVMPNNPYKETTIGNDVWIGDNCLILGGVTIGNGAVVGTGAVVTKDVPPYSVVAGVPARVLRLRFSEEIIEALQVLEWWNYNEKKLRNSIDVFQRNNITMSDVLELKQRLMK